MSMGNNSGSTLFITLIFSLIIMALAGVYVTSQFMLIAPAVDTCRFVQARFNGYSGVWRTLDSLQGDRDNSPALAAINTLDSSFANNQFGSKAALGAPVIADQADSAQSLPLYSAENFGMAAITIRYHGLSFAVESRGNFMDRHKAVVATLCGNASLPSENTLYVQQPGRPTGGRLEGAIVELSNPNSLKNGRPPIDSLNTTLLSALTQSLYRSLPGVDTLFMSPPVTHVRSSEECARLPDTLTGPLMVDGSASAIRWQQKRTIFVLGDVQILGTATLRNVSIFATGEIRLFDDTFCADGTFFSNSRIFMGDRARFDGSAIARDRIVVYQSATVANRSILTVLGDAKTPSQKKPVVDTMATTGDSGRYAIVIADRAHVDGSVVALGTPGGVSIDRAAKISGIVWAAQNVCCNGTVQGVVRAARLVDDRQADAQNGDNAGGNRLKGTIAHHDAIDQYRLPVFLGRMQLEGTHEE